MVLSQDAAINIIFGSVMVVIGLAGIWIVKWSTDKLVSVREHYTCVVMSTSMSIFWN
jgi:hypothetical protein